MQSRLRQAMSQAFTGVGNATTLDDLTDIGITSGKIGSSVDQAKSGLLQIDETKLADAIAYDPQAVQRLMGTAETRLQPRTSRRSSRASPARSTRASRRSPRRPSGSASR